MLAMKGGVWEKRWHKLPELPKGFSIFSGRFLVLWGLCSRFRGRKGDSGKVCHSCFPGEWRDSQLCTTGIQLLMGSLREQEDFGKQKQKWQLFLPLCGPVFFSSSRGIQDPQNPLKSYQTKSNTTSTYSCAGTKKKLGRKQKTDKVRPCS